MVRRDCYAKRAAACFLALILCLGAAVPAATLTEAGATLAEPDTTLAETGATLAEAGATLAEPLDTLDPLDTLEPLDDSTFLTNLAGWQISGGASVAIETAGARITSGGDGFYMSENRFAGNLVFEADITLVSGTAFGLVFDAQRQGDIINGGSYVINFDFNNRNFRFFQFPHQGAAISDLASATFTAAGFTPALGGAYHLTLHVRNGRMSFWINGTQIFRDVVDAVEPMLDSGYVGFIAFNSSAIFQNAYAYGDNSLPVGYPLIGAYGGNAGEGYTLQQTSGNNWVAFSGYGESITYDFTMDLLGGANVVGGAMFGIANPRAIASPWYGVHIERQSQRLRLFREGGPLNEYAGLAPADFDGPMDIRVSIKGKAINIYINDMSAPRMTATLPDTYEGGYIGLMTWQSAAKFTGVRLYDNLMRPVPMLGGITLGGGAALNEAFDPMATAYTADVGYAMESITVTPTLQGSGAQIFVGGSLVASGAESPPIALTTGANAITINLVDEEDPEIANRYTVTVNKAVNPALLYSEPYRPQFHFTPLANWMNDPNGLVYNATTGEYHMFYQHNPFGIAWGNMSWGHAASKDLVHWEERGIALRPDELGTIFSGSAVIDYHNTSGLFPEEVPPASRMVAVFTHDGGSQTYGNEKQSIAYSLDDGDTWIKYGGNPVLRNPGNMYGGDFRDPKVLWMEDPALPNGGEWLMVVAGGRARLFTSPDLINWTHNNDLYYNHQGGSPAALNSECPDLFPLAVDGDLGNIKWVYTGSGRFYVIGDLVKADGKWNFINTTRQYSPYNGGEMMYATQSFFNDANGLSNNLAGGGRRMLVSWMQDGSGSALPGKTWDGYQSIPLVAELRTDADGSVKLSSYVPEEFGSLRSSGGPLASIRGKTVNPGDNNVLEGVAGDLLDIEAVFTIGTATEFGFNVRSNSSGTQKTTVKYDAASRQFILDRSASGSRISGVRSLGMEPMAGNKVSMRILVDTSIIDAFGNGGAAAISSTYYPDPTSVGVSFYSMGGSVTIDSLDIYEMKSSWPSGSGSSDPLGVSVFTEMGSVALGGVFTVSATVVPRNANDKSVSWDYDAAMFELVSMDGTSVTLKAIALGTSAVAATTVAGGLRDSVSVRVIDFRFDTNLGQWHPTSGSWSMEEDGYVLARSSGNSFNVSGQGGRSIVYDVEFTFDSGNRIGGPIFGAVSASPGNDWFAVHIQNNGGTIRLFDETTYGQSGGLNSYETISPALDMNQKICVRVDIDSSGNIKVYASNSPLGDDPAPLITAASARYHGGYVGLMAYESGATFTKARLTVRDAVSVSVGADERTPFGGKAEYVFHAADMKAVNLVELTFTVDGGMLDWAGAEMAGLNGFALFQPVSWKSLGDGRWQGSAILGAFSGAAMSGSMDVGAIALDTKKLGGARLELAGVKVYGIDIVDGTAQPTERLAAVDPALASATTKVFSVYDINGDDAVDLADLSLAFYYYMSSEGDDGWDYAKAADVNGDGRVDMGDLIEIYANFIA